MRWGVLVTMCRKGYGITSVILRFETEDSANEAAIMLNNKTKENSQGTVWGVQYEAIVLKKVSSI